MSEAVELSGKRIGGWNGASWLVEGRVDDGGARGVGRAWRSMRLVWRGRNGVLAGRSGGGPASVRSKEQWMGR